MGFLKRYAHKILFHVMQPIYQTFTAALENLETKPRVFNESEIAPPASQKINCLSDLLSLWQGINCHLHEWQSCDVILTCALTQPGAELYFAQQRY
jgi:hypothetical protein